MRTLRLAALLSSIALPSVAHAQRPASADSVPRAGQWAVELGLGSANGASLIRFWSPESAALLGAGFEVTRDESNASGPGAPDNSVTYTNANARLGVRRYRRSSTERLRPIMGVGARGSVTRATNDGKGWSAGIYGEVGAVYFVAPHLSLGGVGEVHARYSKQTQSGTSFEATRTELGASLIQLLISVYF